MSNHIHASAAARTSFLPSAPSYAPYRHPAYLQISSRSIPIDNSRCCPPPPPRFPPPLPCPAGIPHVDTHMTSVGLAPTPSLLVIVQFENDMHADDVILQYCEIERYSKRS